MKSSEFNLTASVESVTDLAPDYYLKNFQFLMEWVWSKYADLLNETEQNFVLTFRQLDRDAQCLLVRLAGRKGSLFRRDRLNYVEIDCIDTAAVKLITAGLLQTNAPLDIATLCNSLTKPELLLLFSDQLSGFKQARKEVVLSHLTSLFPESRSWQDWTDRQLGEAYFFDSRSIIKTLMLLFFGNNHQDLTEFVLQDLGLFRYDSYSIDDQHRLFNDREELMQYQHLLQCRDALEVDSSLESLITLANNLPTGLNERLQRRKAKLCNQLAYALEQNNEMSLALSLYEQSHLPPARERCIRLLEKQGKVEDAWKLLTELMSAPANQQELQVAQRMAPRLAKKMDALLAKEISFVKKTSTPLITQTLQLTPTVDHDGNTQRVEEVVRSFLETADAPCVYTENTLINGLFGLWLWPEMFRSVKGAFANPFQLAPLDMYHESFVANRPGIDLLWRDIANGEYRQRILQLWEDKWGIANHFVNWSALTNDLITTALHCIPALHLHYFFERLLFDLKSNRNGFPDLIQFYPAQKTYRMIEVKGPGDKLQDNQVRWLDYFAEKKIPAEVIYVIWK